MGKSYKDGRNKYTVENTKPKPKDWYTHEDWVEDQCSDCGTIGSHICEVSYDNDGLD
jgi:hypothetical protein